MERLIKMLGLETIIPPFLAAGLVLSWVIWARFFNNGSFKMEGKIQAIIDILRMFFIFSVFLAGLVYIYFITIAFLIVTDKTVAQGIISNFTSILLLLYLTILFVAILAVEKKHKKESFATALFGLNLFLFFGLFIFLGLLAASFFSVYSEIYFERLFVITGFYFMFTSLLLVLNGRLFGEKSKLFKSMKETFRQRNFWICGIIVFIVSLIGFLMIFPALSDTSEMNVKYELKGRYELYLHKTAINRLGHLGISTPISNWLPLYFSDFDVQILNTKANRTYFYEDSFRILLKDKEGKENSYRLVDFFDKRDKTAGLKLITYDKKTNDLIFEIDREQLKKQNISEINFIGIKELPYSFNNFPVQVKEVVKSEKNKVFVTSNIFSNLTDLPVELNNFFVASLGGINVNLTECKITNISSVIYAVSGEIIDTELNCDSNRAYCNVGNEKIDGTLWLEGNLLMLKMNSFYFDSMELNISLNC